MAIYSMVKNNTFNGIGLPDIVLRHENGECEVVKHFGYEDFKGRLGDNYIKFDINTDKTSSTIFVYEKR